MSGNIKFIGEKSQETVQLPSKGMGGFFGKQSNTKGADNALIKFADSFSEEKTKNQMEAAFPNLAQQIPGKNMDASARLSTLKNLLTVTSKPKDDEDCSIFIVQSKKVAPVVEAAETSRVKLNPSADMYEKSVNTSYKSPSAPLPAKPTVRSPSSLRSEPYKYEKATGGKSRRRRRHSKKARCSTNKKRKSRRFKRKSYKR